MRILLDESVHVQVRNALISHQVSTAVEMGWQGIANGELLDRAEAAGFQLLIVADKNFQTSAKPAGPAYRHLGALD